MHLFVPSSNQIKLNNLQSTSNPELFSQVEGTGQTTHPILQRFIFCQLLATAYVNRQIAYDFIAFAVGYYDRNKSIAKLCT